MTGKILIFLSDPRRKIRILMYKENYDVVLNSI